MTFCVGTKVRTGLVALADTRIVRGFEHLRKSKIARLEHPTGSVFLMTSGLRSVRDKACVYFEEGLRADEAAGITRMFEAANLFGTQLRRVRQEDGAALGSSGLSFNLHAIIGGKLIDDVEPALFLIYPEGNWIEATEDTPYYVIGRASFGKPILDRLLDSDASLSKALLLSFLAFDATRASVTDVDFPIDVVLMEADSAELRERRFERSALERLSQCWEEKLGRALDELPMCWANELLRRTDES